MKTSINAKNSLRLILLSILSMLLLSSCAGMGTTGSKYMNERIFHVNQDINIEKATNVAVQALQNMKVKVTQQNSASGFISGIYETGVWVNRETFFIELYISTLDKKQVRVHATTVAGPQTAFTNELDDIVEDFYKSFEKSLSYSYK